VQAFVNTLDTENGIEEVDGPDALRDLLLRIGLLDPDDEVGEGDVDRARDVREALRELLLANNGGSAGPAALETLERAGRAGRLEVRFHDGAAELVAGAPGIDGALGGLVAITYTAIAAGTWPRLKACRREICKWVFYDRSRNGSSTWCAMSVCGNRTKTQAYRSRRR
jgi:predicted RNA-binding Zn ribbon-like protein